jgi:hypothetical protein
VEVALLEVVQAQEEVWEVALIQDLLHPHPPVEGAQAILAEAVVLHHQEATRQAAAGVLHLHHEAIHQAVAAAVQAVAIPVEAVEVLHVHPVVVAHRVRLVADPHVHRVVEDNLSFG